jgi:hypothetical protein
MALITSPEMFINMKRIPDIESQEYVPFFEAEKKKCKTGVTINGTLIPPWVYWNTNHWQIDIDITDPETGFPERKRSRPELWDNVWDIGEHVQKAQLLRSGLLILGTRQFGKSEFGASYEGWRGVCFENTQNILAGLSSEDLSGLLLKLDRGLTNVTPYFKPMRIKDEWDKEVILGYKTPQGERTVWSQYLIRNLEKGKNTEKLAGPTASSLLLDEAGKGDWLEAFIAAEPAMRTPYGWRCLPLIIGTSGSFDKARDLKKFREHLATYNFIQMEVKDHKGTMVSFVPGYRSSLAERKKVRLSTHLGVPKGSELDVIPIHKVTDPAREATKINREIEALEKTNEFTLAKKKRMYYPEIEEHLFLTDDTNNIFSDLKDLAKAHLTYLENTDYFEEYGWLEPSIEGRPKWIPAKPHEKPIMNFPMKEHESKDAPIVIWDHPIETEDYGILHVAGTDPYNQEESAYSPSLGVTYIYRRMYDALSGKFQRRFVACYAARPNNMNKWYKQTKLLLEYYQATDLPENENKEFIRYFDERQAAHMLEDGIDLAREINPNTKNKRQKGLSAAPANQKYGNGIFKGYCLEELDMGEGNNGENIIKPGIIRIPDKVLLMEIIAYVPGMNVDRIVAARHALIHAHTKDKYFPIAKVKKAPEPEKKKPRTIHTPFTTKRFGTFAGKRGKYF